jgi:plasmid maintenance system antidote protein VapI
MDPEKLRIVKESIEKESLKRFSDIFHTLSKDDMADNLHINRTRFRDLVKHPLPLRISEIYRMAKILDVKARLISQLIHNQLDTPAKGERTKSK